MKKNLLFLLMVVSFALATYLGSVHPETAYFEEKDLFLWSMDTYMKIVFVLSVDLYVISFLLFYLLVKKYNLDYYLSFLLLLIMPVVALFTTHISILQFLVG